jgi:site-specific recombinase XerD
LLSDPRRFHDRVVSARRGGAASLTRDDARLSRRTTSTQQGVQYPADPATVDEIVAVMRHTGDNRHGFRLRAIIVVLWRAGLRVQEALALTEHDLDDRRGSLRVRRGKGGRRREVGMDEWAWEQLRPWLTARAELPPGPLFCIIDGATRGRPWSAAAVRREFHAVAAKAGVRRRFAPHQLCHAHAVEAHEGVPLIVIQRQLGHSNLGITSIYLQRHRRRRDHRSRPRPASAGAPGQRIAAALRQRRCERRSSREAAASPQRAALARADTVRWEAGGGERG